MLTQQLRLSSIEISLMAGASQENQMTRYSLLINTLLWKLLPDVLCLKVLLVMTTVYATCIEEFDLKLPSYVQSSS